MCTQPDAPDWGFQQIAAVRAEHRGHRLGLLLKLAMLDPLRKHQPGVRRIETSNADENAHMIAINEQLGFTITGVRRHWELDLAGDGAVTGPAACTVIPAGAANPYS